MVVAHPRNQLDGPPGFPPLFPELSKQEQQMALLYISHADETERRARIERVRQGIAENAADAAMRITKITSDINKGKGHVFENQSLDKSTSHWKQTRV